MASDEQLWHAYALASVAAGHRHIATIDEIATDVLALHRRKFPVESPAQAPADASAAPEATNATPAPQAADKSTTTSDKPAKGKDASR